MVWQGAHCIYVVHLQVRRFGVGVNCIYMVHLQTVGFRVDVAGICVVQWCTYSSVSAWFDGHRIDHWPAS